MTNKKKWALAFAIAAILFAPSTAFAAVTTTTGTATNAISSIHYSCNSGDTLNETTCTTPVVQIPAHDVTTQVPAQSSIVDYSCSAYDHPGYPSFMRYGFCAHTNGDNDRYWYADDPQPVYAYTCSSGTLKDSNCDVVTSIPATSTGGTIYTASSSNTYSCPSGQILSGDNQCSGTGSTVFNATELGSTLVTWITSHLLAGIAALLALGIAIRLTIKAVRKYAKA